MTDTSTQGAAPAAPAQPILVNAQPATDQVEAALRMLLFAASAVLTALGYTGMAGKASQLLLAVGPLHANQEPESRYHGDDPAGQCGHHEARVGPMTLHLFGEIVLWSLVTFIVCYVVYEGLRWLWAVFVDRDF